MLNKILAFNFGLAENVRRNRFIKFGIVSSPFVSLPTKDIIATNVNQLCPNLLGGYGYIPGADGIY